MKLKKTILIIFLGLLPLLSSGEEIPEIVKQDPKNLEWNWTIYSTNAPNYFAADFTKKVKVNDGTIFLPWAAFDSKSKKYTSNIFWSRINCEKNTIDSPGYFDKSFSMSIPTTYFDDQVGAIPKHMICGVMTNENKKIYGYAATSSNTHLGWYPDEVVKQNETQEIYDVTSRTYNINNRQILPLSEGMVINCSQPSLTHSKKVYLTNEQPNYWVRYFVESVCTYGKTGILADGSRAKDRVQDMVITEKLKEKEGSQVENKKMNIETAKSKCTDLGFNQKTAQFGKCVLELTK